MQEWEVGRGGVQETAIETCEEPAEEETGA